MVSEQYQEAFIICKLKRINTDDTDRIVLDVPFTVINQHVISNGRNFHSSEIPLEYAGKECIAHVVYRAHEDALVEKIADVKRHAKYKTHWPQTVGDVETARLRAALPDDYDGELPVYDGPDADDPAPFCVFARDGYEDK